MFTENFGPKTTGQDLFGTKLAAQGFLDNCSRPLISNTVEGMDKNAILKNSVKLGKAILCLLQRRASYKDLEHLVYTHVINEPSKQWSFRLLDFVGVDLRVSNYATQKPRTLKVSWFITELPPKIFIDLKKIF